MSRAFAAFLVPFAVLLAPSSGVAQSTDDWTYQIGGRTTFMVGTMRLSHLGGGFSDLPPGGGRLTHASSLFFLWPRGSHVRLGIETLVGNSYGDSDAGILFQAVGVLAEYQTRGTWFMAVGAQGGAMIASATEPTSQAGGTTPVHTGSYYKGSGLFVAPSVAIGRAFGRTEVRVLVKPVLHIPGSAGLDAFDSTYLGVSLGLRRR
jgi:hypothetical protein